MARRKFTIAPVETSRPVASIDKEILGKSVDDGVYPLAMAKEIRLDRIQPDPNNPRRSWDEDKLQELASSIREQGVLQPIVVEYVDDGNYFRLVHGERRWRASQLAERPTIPAIIHRVDDGTRLVRQLIENIQREDLNDVDRALALQQLKVNLGSPSWDVIAERVGISKRRVLQLVDVTRLPEPIQESIRSGELTEKHGRAAKMLPDERRLEFAEEMRAQQLSGDESLEVAKALKSEPEAPLAEVIAHVKERQAHDRRARKPKPLEADVPQGDTASEKRPTAAAGEPGPEIVRYLIEQPQPEPDPLAPLRVIPAMIANFDPAAADSAQAQSLLEEIIAAAQDALIKVRGTTS